MRRAQILGVVAKNPLHVEALSSINCTIFEWLRALSMCRFTISRLFDLHSSAGGTAGLKALVRSAAKPVFPPPSRTSH